MFQSTEKLSRKMLSTKAIVLVLTLVACAVNAVHGEEETTEKPGFAEAAKGKWQQGVEAAKKGIAKAEEAFNNAKEKDLHRMNPVEPIQVFEGERMIDGKVDNIFKREIGPMASNFSEGFKEKFNEGVQKAQDMFKEAKETISSHVSPFVNKVRKGMLDGVRNLRDKLHKKDGGKEGSEPKEAAESSEKATVKAEINSGENGA